MIRHFASRQFTAFLCTGAAAAALNFGSRIAYSLWFSLSTAILLAYATGMIAAYVLARAFVFTTGTQSVRRSALIFVAVNVVAALQTWLVSMGLAYYVLPAFNVTHFALEISHAIGVACPVFTSYLGHKHWSFAEAPPLVRRSQPG